MNFQETQASNIEKDADQEVNAMKKRPVSANTQKNIHNLLLVLIKIQLKLQGLVKLLECFRCGGPFPHRGIKCPALGQSCKGCKKENHFASVCLSRKKQFPVQKIVNESESDSNSEDEYVFATSKGNKSPNTTVKMLGQNISLMVDSGSSVNIINKEK